jgi:hypothetical protein
MADTKVHSLDVTHDELLAGMSASKMALDGMVAEGSHVSEEFTTLKSFYNKSVTLHNFLIDIEFI